MHGEFVVAALREEAGAELVAGWEADPRRGPALERALGVELAPTPEALVEDPRIQILASAAIRATRLIGSSEPPPRESTSS